MSVLKFLNNLLFKLETLPFVGPIFGSMRYPAKKFVARFQLMSQKSWDKRISTVLQCPDNEALPRVENAGRISNNVMTMHNGIKVREGSYYGVGMTRLLLANRGVHEPQEERVFAAVVKAIKPNSTMIELGAYWGFYSLWFAKEVENARCILVEPTQSNLDYGRKNFHLNGKSAEFIQAYLGEKENLEFANVPVISVDEICRVRDIQHLQVLHADIQGAEYEMILGSSSMLSSHRVDFIFVSTHSESLHGAVKLKLQDWGYIRLADVAPENSFSDDGILVMKSPLIEFTLDFEVSLRSHSTPKRKVEISSPAAL